LYDILLPLSESGANILKVSCAPALFDTSCGGEREGGEPALPSEPVEVGAEDGRCSDVKQTARCEVYPEGGLSNLCDGYGLEGMPVFIPAGLCIEDLFKRIERYTKTTGIATEQCFPYMLQVFVFAYSCIACAIFLSNIEFEDCNEREWRERSGVRGRGGGIC
jgi:hypothetical protein